MHRHRAVACCLQGVTPGQVFVLEQSRHGASTGVLAPPLGLLYVAIGLYLARLRVDLANESPVCTKAGAWGGVGPRRVIDSSPRACRRGSGMVEFGHTVFQLRLKIARGPGQVAACPGFAFSGGCPAKREAPGNPTPVSTGKTAGFDGREPGRATSTRLPRTAIPSPTLPHPGD